MSEITEALSALKAILGSELSGLGPAAIWIHPDDAGSITPSDDPFIILSEEIGTEGAWASGTWGSGEHAWVANIAIFLHRFGGSPVAFESAAFAPALAKRESWLRAVAGALNNNLTLNGTAVYIGDGERLFTYIADYIHWEQEVYFGLVISLPIYQLVLQDYSS